MTRLEKIKLNRELDREAAEISALSSRELKKYEYLTDEDLGNKSDAIQKGKFEYYPLGKIFDKGLDESDKKEELLKRLNNIKDKGEEQLKMIENEKDDQLNTNGFMLKPLVTMNLILETISL